MQIGPVADDIVIWEILRSDHECHQLVGLPNQLVKTPDFTSQKENYMRRAALYTTTRKHILQRFSKWQRDLLTLDMLDMAITVWKTSDGKDLVLTLIAKEVEFRRLPEFADKYGVKICAYGSQKTVLHFAYAAANPAGRHVFNGSVWGKRPGERLVLLDGTHRCLGLYIHFVLRKPKTAFPCLYCYIGIPNTE